MQKQLLRFNLFLLMCLTLPLMATAQVVDIPDPNLRAAIESALGKVANATITVEEMATLGEGGWTSSFDARGSNISNLTGLEFATGLDGLYLSNNAISDISALAGLTNLDWLYLSNNAISDISALAGLTNLDWLYLSNNSISDISALAGLTNLDELYLSNNSISDISALAGLTNLYRLHLSNNSISDISALAGLTNLDELYLSNNSISDISALAGLTNLDELYLSNNAISDISALAGLTNLDELYLSNNAISDISALAGLTNLNWLFLSNNNISDLFPLVANPGLGVPIEAIALDDHELGDWNNKIEYLERGDVIGVQGNPLSDTSINTHIPTLRGRGIAGFYRSRIFLPLIAPVAVGQRFTLNLTVQDVFDLAGWQLDLAFNPAALKAISVSEGDFLSQAGRNTFFQEGNINNAVGTITGISGAVIDTGGVGGTGTLFSINFEAKAAGEGRLRVSEGRLGASNGNQIHYDIVIQPVTVAIIVEPTYDLNGDKKVDVLDLMLVAQNFGQANPQADANHDGTVDVFDLIAVAQHLDSAPQAPSGLAYHRSTLHSTTIQNWIDMAYAADDSSLAFRQAIANLKRLLAAMVPDKTALLTNYPNPFNPETWIPYHLAHAADVTLTIYDTKGALVRQLDLGHQMAGFYTDRTKAAYWDGQSETGEQVTSGVYFYHLSAGDYSATRKMLILK